MCVIAELCAWRVSGQIDTAPDPLLQLAAPANHNRVPPAAVLQEARCLLEEPIGADD